MLYNKTYEEIIFMERNQKPLTDNCNMSGLRPAMAGLPYPPIQVCRRNRDYADLLSVDYCGSVSELTAITQYINNESRLCGENCPYARVLLEIAMAEMMHLQKLGQLIVLLGGDIDYTARQPGARDKLWTPAYLTIPEGQRRMLCADIEAERAAIRQYEAHMARIDDDCVNATLARIIKDEKYHIMLLEDLMEEPG